MRRNDHFGAVKRFHQGDSSNLPAVVCATKKGAWCESSDHGPPCLTARGDPDPSIIRSSPTIIAKGLNHQGKGVRSGAGLQAGLGREKPGKCDHWLSAVIRVKCAKSGFCKSSEGLHFVTFGGCKRLGEWGSGGRWFESSRPDKGTFVKRRMSLFHYFYSRTRQSRTLTRSQRTRGCSRSRCAC